MMVIDADGHVEESTAMFGFLEREFYPRRPIPLSFDEDTVFGVENAVWLIDAKAYPRVVGKGGVRFATPTLMKRAQLKPISIPAQELTDVEARLKDLDRMGIDSQVVYPTMLLWVAWDKSLGDESLYPFYEEAGKLDLPICVHFGWGCPAITDVFEAHESFYSAVLPVVMGFHSLMCAGVLDMFPKLRLGFLESASFWVPYVIHQLRRSKRARCAKDPAEYFKEGRVYIACEADEDIKYITQVIGEDCLVVASDYPHLDASHEASMKDA